MQLTRIFIKRPTLVFVFVALTLLAAFMALRQLVVQESPNSGLPGITISVSESGASTTDLQTQVAEPVENQLAGLPYLDHINTTIQSGQVQIAAAFSLQSTDTENIANVERALQAAQAQLPTNITPPTLRVANPSEPTIVTIALTSKKYSQSSLAAIANNTIVPAMEQIAGVSSVNVGGTTQAAFMVRVNPDMLAANNLTLTDVVNAISPNNTRPPGGIVYGPGRETTLDVRGDLPDPQSVANLPIHVSYGSSGSGNTSSTNGGTAATSSSSGGGGGAINGMGGASSAPGSAVTAATSDLTTAAAGTGVAVAPLPNTTFAPRAYQVPANAGRSSTGTGNAASSVGLLNTSGDVGTANGGASAAGGGSASGTGGASATGGAATGGTGSSATGSAGSSATGNAGANATGGTGAAAAGGAATGATTGAANTTGAATGATATTGASGGATSAASGAGAVSSSGAAASQLSGVGSASAGTSSSGTLTAQSASPTVPVDTAVTPVTTSSNSVTSGASIPAAVSPNVSSSAFGGGSGLSLSPMVGNLAQWATPSSDKRVSDIAQVLDSSVVPRIFTSQNGRPGVALFVQKQASASEVTVSNAVIKQLPALKKQFPDVDFEVAHVQSTFTEEQVQSVEHTLVEGIILTAVVMLFFLGSWRNAIVVMIAIPTSLGVTLFVMDALHLTLDTVSLMAMTLVIGILIDDSTVVLENVERHHAMGEAAPDAALNGRSEIGLAAIVITMVDVVVFLPIAFASGQVGQYLSEFAIVITIATLTSLFVSFTVTPTLAGLWSMKSQWKPWPPIRWFDRRFNGLRDRYTKAWLPPAFRYPWPLLIVAALLCVGSIFLVPTGLVGEEFIPAEDQGIIYAQVTLPPGHPLAQTRTLMNRLEVAVKQTIAAADLQYEITISGAYAAAFGGFVQEGNVGQISIYLSQSHHTSTYTYVDRLRNVLTHDATGATVSVAAATQQGGGNQQQIDELVGSNDGSDPTAAAAKVFSALQSTPGVSGPQNSASNAAPQMEVDFNRPALQALDVTTSTAATAIEAAFGGDVVSQIETPNKGLTQIEIIYQKSAQQHLSDVLNIPIRSTNGGIVHVGDVARLRYAPAPLVITRENRSEVVHVTANTAPGYNLSDVTKDFQQRVKALKLPANITIHPAAQGQQDLMNQALVVLGASLAVSILLVFFMIVALYNSYRTPFVTLFAIPLATIGALGALWITHSTLNLYSLIGMVLLVGLVTKNGILLVDYADTERERGKSRQQGIRDAAMTRFRPIIMTTLAMVAGMLPLALGLEPGAQSRASLAIAVIGGMLSSLVLTLFIVPIMYSWIAPKELKGETQFADERRNAPPQAGPAPA